MALPPPEPPRSRRPRAPAAPARPPPPARAWSPLALPLARARALLALPLARARSPLALPLTRARAALVLPLTRARAALVLPVALGLGGCAVGTSPCEPRLTYAVASPPPRPLTETPSARPTPGMVWVPGYWHWDAIRYVWVPGHWETPPPGRRWLPAETRSEGGAYRYYAGVWGCDAG